LDFRQRGNDPEGGENHKIAQFIFTKQLNNFKKLEFPYE